MTKKWEFRGGKLLCIEYNMGYAVRIIHKIHLVRILYLVILTAMVVFFLWLEWQKFSACMQIFNNFFFCI